MIAIVGAGRVGTAIGMRLKRAGYPIGGVMRRSQAAAEEAVRLIGDGTPVSEIKACLDADVMFVTVPDHALTEVAATIGAALVESGRGDLPLTLVHTSGALASDVLRVASADDKRISVVSMHPIQTVADPIGGAERLAGAVWGIEGDASALPLAQDLVRAMQGKPVVLDKDKKPLYHAAASVSSNFLITLVDIGLKMMGAAGVDRDDAMDALATLMAGAIQNARELGVPRALTGPIDRGDVHTVLAHLDSIEQMIQVSPTGGWSDIQDVYRVLARYTVGVARQKHGLNGGVSDRPVENDHPDLVQHLKDRLDRLEEELDN